MMICIEKTALDDHAFMCIQDFSSLLSSSTQAPLHNFHLQQADRVMAMAMIGQQADPVSHSSDIWSFLPLTHTPPQVDEFGCSNRRIEAVGRRKRKQVYGEGQEKGGDRKTDKTKTDKSKSDKSKRENDKGLKKVKPPKRDGLASLL